jgi:threonylcarbamoyladenosine tRNA methylthiotransferase MtaB
MPQVNGATIKQRAARLREAGETALTRHLQRYAGRVVTGLVERNGIARLDDFTPVRLAGQAAPGTLQNVRITAHLKSMLAGEIVP